MNRTLAAIATLVASFVIATCPPALADGDAPTQVTTPAGYTGPSIYGLWSKVGDVTTIPVYSRVDRRWGVSRIVTEWNEANVVQMVLTSTPCQGCITISQTRNLTPFGEDIGSWLGAASVDAPGGVVIQHCDIMLNMRAFFPNWAAGRRSTVAHEIGHCLGLSHSTRENTAVGTMSGLDGPTWRDLEWIRQLYGPPAVM